MPVIIQKFGGSLLETPEHIKRAAAYIIQTKINGDDPVVVVSAPGSTTDRFLELARQVADKPDERETDMLLSVGERTAMALLAMAINADGRFHAVSFTGSQIGIITDTKHTDARIIEVKCLRIKESLTKKQIPIVAGFQGVSTDKEITTLGRGGSDATAVAIAGALKADRCELIKESGAIYSADPQLIPEAVSLSDIDYNTLEALSSAGACVVQPHAASLAKEHNVRLEITGVENQRGTLITDRCLEISKVVSVVLDENLHLVTLDKNQSLAGIDKIHFAVRENDRMFIAVNNGNCPGKSQTVAVVTVVCSNIMIDGALIEIILDAISEAGIIPVTMIVINRNLSIVVEQTWGTKALQTIHNCCLKKGLIKH
ncbi:aspartate kinase [bacterium]|nr:aspartate kinase [bacterium]